MPGDGNCLFYCLAFFLYKDLNLAVQVRHSTVNFVAKYWHKYRSFLLDSNGEEYANEYEYVKKASLNSYYASEIEIQASAEKFKLFIVIKKDGQTLVFGDPNHRKIYVAHKYSFDNGHFDLLIPNNEASSVSLPKNDVPTMEQRVTEVKV